MNLIRKYSFLHSWKLFRGKTSVNLTNVNERQNLRLLKRMFQKDPCKDFNHPVAQSFKVHKNIYNGLNGSLFITTKYGKVWDP